MAYYVDFYSYYVGNKITQILKNCFINYLVNNLTKKLVKKLLTHIFICDIISLVKGHCPQLKEVL